MKNGVILWTSRLALVALAAVFLYAGVVKWQSPQAFADAIDGYRLPLGPLANALAIVLPPLEIAAGVALFFGRTRGGALLVLAALNMIFLAALVQAAVRGFTVDCGCFDSAAPTAAGMARSIARDALLFAVILWLWFREGKQTREPSSLLPPAPVEI